MATWTASSISRAGRLMIPQKLRARLAPRADSKVLLQEVADGVILLSKEPLARPRIAEYLLDSLVTGIGPEAELLGFHDEEDLDRVVAMIRERTFAER
jgi:bifunctional DNA-binding transcriptional regulator/antitoxin component of YhaV-PrlF toxin-antitoxin module